MSKPNVDILLATYNGADFLGEQLDSLLRQTCRDWQLLIRDDGSEDRTLTIIESYIASRPGQIYLLKDNHRALGAAGNFAKLIKYSQAEYTLFCDQDDVWLKEKLELSLKRIQELEAAHGKATPLLVHTDLKVVDKNLTTLANSFWQHQNLDPSTGKQWNRLLVQNVVTGCTTIINRALREVAMPIPGAAIMHDWWLALVASLLGRVEFIDQPTILYRQHGHNDTGAKKWGAQFILSRISKTDEMRKSLQKTQIQASALVQHLATKSNKINPEVIAVIQGFSGLAAMRPFERRAFVLRHGILKQGIIRNIGMLVNL
jgi:glycosyltransferase involved in cell wall biosynthesis